MNAHAKAQVKKHSANGATAPVVTDAPPSAAAQAGENLVPAETVSLKAAELEDLKAEAAKAEEHWDKLVRATADFENFKKRSARDRQDAIKYANEGLIEKLIPIMDTFEMALASANPVQEGPLKSFQAGVNMIYQQLKRVLTDAGVEEIDATNRPFDPNLHAALSQQETADVPEGQVLQQLRKGYKLRDRLIRPAGVVVAKAPASK